MEEDARTTEVEMLLGNPKKAILAMAIPTTVALMAQAANNLVDAIWVAGLGPGAMAAIGFVFPLFMIIIGISNGIGVGAASAIARRIGRNDKEEADNAASHAIVLVILASLILTPILYFSLEPLLTMISNGFVVDLSLAYAQPAVMMLFVFMLVGVMSSILRSEGAAKRSMYILIVAAILNMVLDPIFIYDDMLFGFGLGMGMAGAAWATVLAESVALVVMMYWYFVKKDLFLRFKFKGFKFNREISSDVFRVGIPASMEMMIISIVSIAMNLILTMAGGDRAVAIYSSDWRILQILMIPLNGIAYAVVPVCAAAFGAKRPDNIKEGYTYSLKISLIAMIVIAVITAVFAEYITMAFTYTEETSVLRPDMVEFLRIACVFLPFLAFGAVSASLFQSLGMGLKSLVATVFRNSLMLPVCYLLIGSGLTAIWWGVTGAEIAGSMLIGIWCLLVLKELLKGHTPPEDRNAEAV